MANISWLTTFRQSSQSISRVNNTYSYVYPRRPLWLCDQPPRSKSYMQPCGSRQHCFSLRNPHPIRAAVILRNNHFVEDNYPNVQYPCLLFSWQAGFFEPQLDGRGHIWGSSYPDLVGSIPLMAKNWLLFSCVTRYKFLASESLEMLVSSSNLDSAADSI